MMEAAAMQAYARLSPTAKLISNVSACVNVLQRSLKMEQLEPAAASLRAIATKQGVVGLCALVELKALQAIYNLITVIDKEMDLEHSIAQVEPLLGHLMVTLVCVSYYQPARALLHNLGAVRVAVLVLDKSDVSTRHGR